MRWSGFALVATVAALAGSASAGAEVVDDNPAASSRGPGQVTVFIRGADGTLHTSDLSGGSFTPWRSLGGYLDSGPGAGARSATVGDVFVRGSNSSMYTQYFISTSGWSGWGALGGNMLSAPGVTVRKGGGYIDTYYRGPDNGIVARSWVPGSGWTAENTTALDPGLTLSAPALVSRANEVLAVIVRGTNDYVHINEWNGSAWSGWAQIPGGMLTAHAPAATTRQYGTMDVFVRTRSGGVAWASYDGAAWSAWKTVPGSVDSGLAAVSDHPSRIYLFARRGGDVVWNLYEAGTGPEAGWRGWQPTHPPPPPPPPPAPPPACDAAAGRVTAHAPIARYGRGVRLSGRARRGDGAPLVSAIVTVTPVRGSWRRQAVAATSGHYAMRLPPGPSRRVRVQAQAPGANALACATVRVKTRAGVRLRASRRVRPGGRVRFRGRLLGKPIPRRGKLVELQAFDAGRWRVFAQPRARRNGRFRTSYRLQRTFRPRTFRFRARVRPESAYPYTLGYSKVVRVRVR
jgi:hypothetical protein